MIMRGIMKKNMFICLIAVIITIIHGCARVHFTVTSAPVPPEHAPSFKTEAAEIPVVVQGTNFVINKVDTQYPESEKEVFQRHYAPQFLTHCKTPWVNGRFFLVLLVLPFQIPLRRIIYCLVIMIFSHVWELKDENGFHSQALSVQK